MKQRHRHLKPQLFCFFFLSNSRSESRVPLTFLLASSQLQWKRGRPADTVDFNSTGCSEDEVRWPTKLIATKAATVVLCCIRAFFPQSVDIRNVLVQLDCQNCWGKDMGRRFSSCT